MKKLSKILALVAIIVSSSFFLSACNTKKTSEDTTKTPVKTTKKAIELAESEQPYVKLIPSSNGHNLTFKLSKIPQKFSIAEYELIYTAKDENIEIEKGVSGTVELKGQDVEKDLLLGTSSCTNGCKYKYDEGVTGGTLTITLFTPEKEYFSYETQFVLLTGAQINKEKNIALNQYGFVVNATATSKAEFFIALKNFGTKYSIFSSSTGKGKITSVEPSTLVKSDLNTLVGDYQ